MSAPPRARMLTRTLAPRSPFDFELALEYLRRSPSTVLEDVSGGKYRRALVLDGRPAVVTVSLPGSGDGGLLLSLEGEGLGDEHVGRAMAMVTHVFGIDHDLA